MVSTKKIVPSIIQTGAEFGYSVSIDNNGTRAIIGAPLENVTPPVPDPSDIFTSPTPELDRGAAYIFERNTGGSNNWGEEERLIATNDNTNFPDGPWSSENGQFGYSVIIDNNSEMVLIGSPNATFLTQPLSV